MLTTSRTEFKQVAIAREKEAEALLKARQWSGAYYLIGYAVECGLKAIIATKFKANAFPDKDLVRDAFQHGLTKLVGIAGLTQIQQQAFNADPILRVNWATAKDWTVESRYTKWTRGQAEAMVSAITDQQHGVMKWLRTVW